MKLGLIGHKEDARGRTLLLRDILLPDLAYPESFDLMFGLTPDRDDLGNIVRGVCALAGPGHKCRWADQLNKRLTDVFAEQVLREYENFGYVPGDDSTDRGCYALDVMNRWRKVGLFGGRKIEAFAQVDFLNRDEVRKAAFLLGGVFFCFALPKRVASGDIFEADTWDVAEDDGGNLGGHLVWGAEVVNSWGLNVRVTDAFRSRYCFDAYATMSAEDLAPGGRAFSGLDLAGLRRALSAVTA